MVASQTVPLITATRVVSLGPSGLVVIYYYYGISFTSILFVSTQASSVTYGSKTLTFSEEALTLTR